MKKWMQLFFVFFGGVVGFQWNGYGEAGNLALSGSSRAGFDYWMVAVGAIIGYIAGSVLFVVIKRLLHNNGDPAQLPLSDLLSGMFGLIMGLLIAVLLFPSLAKLDLVGDWLPIAATMMLGIGGFRLGCSKKTEWSALLSKIRLGKEPENDNPLFEEHKILDTSVIIDGRIADICKTGFIEGTLVIPEFVLEELQHIADSSDLLKRNRGRRGLDILNKIQKELEVKVLIYEGDFEEISEVDSKLVKLAKVLRGKVITNDFNLNKVCELQGVSVLNINDLANAVKPVVLPGEEIVIQIIKDGKEYGQGVAYLDDGTMIVVEGGREYIGMTMEVMVTSVLQTSAGRMIFAKPKLLEKAQ